MKSYNNEKAIISLTSWTARIKTVYKTISSLLKNCPNFHIVLVLSKEEFPNKENDLPNNLIQYIKDIEIIWTKDNIKAHKKFFYTMMKYRNIPIITVDDDNEINANIGEILYKSYLKEPNVIHAGRCHEMTYKNNEIQKYKDWHGEQKQILEASMKLFATGVGCVLYPPDILKISENDRDLIKLTETNDDFFLKEKEIMLNIKIKYVPGIEIKKQLIPISGTQDSALLLVNTRGQNKNDDYINLFKNDFNKCNI